MAWKLLSRLVYAHSGSSMAGFVAPNANWVTFADGGGEVGLQDYQALILLIAL